MVSLLEIPQLELPFASIRQGEGAVVALAVHHGHVLRQEVVPYVTLEESTRFREEDPYTGHWATCADTYLVGQRSRFEVDLNRPREKAVYQTLEDAWGLSVWQNKNPLPEQMILNSLALYDAFYQRLEAVLLALLKRHPRVVVFDLHSYNYCRRGSDQPASQAENPEVNLGTGTMDRTYWAPVVNRVLMALQRFDFLGRTLDVRENVRFQGGQIPRWIHGRFPRSVCALAIEFKKFFMDEWTGLPDQEPLQAIQHALKSTIPEVWAGLEEMAT